MIAMYAALGGGGGAMASSSSRSLPAASSSALLSASFPGPGLWRRRRMLVGRDVVVGLAAQVSSCRLASQPCLVQVPGANLFIGSVPGSLDAARVGIMITTSRRKKIGV